jgi:hypothetical protein
MDDRVKTNEVIVKNSPVEFVIIGPKGEHRGIIVRSEHAGADIVGAAAYSEFSKFDVFKMNKVFPFYIFKGKDEYNFARSYTLSNLDSDDRLSDYFFVWKGKATKKDIHYIEKEFSRRASDIRYAVKDNDTSRIEWNVGPIVYLCEQASMSYEKKRKLNIYLLFGILILYIAAFLMIYM